jgi:hypothetical protein
MSHRTLPRAARSTRIALDPADGARLHPAGLRGTRVALGGFVRVLSSLVALGLVSGCLIPQQVQIDPPGNTPPSILDLSARPAGYRPIGSHIDLGDLEGPDGGLPTAITLEALVRDPDVDETLEYQVWVNYPATPLSVTRVQDFVDADADDDPTVRRFRYELPLTAVSATACSRVELFITGGFSARGDLRDPVLPGDLGTATWWVVADETVPVSSCPEAP